MFCRNCGKEINANAAICLECGVKKGEGSSYCWNCGSTVEENADVCLNCGASVKKDNSYERLAGQDKTTMIIICILFGWLGIHNFMMGEIKKGIVKIVITLFCFAIGGFLLSMIDLINICNDRYDANPYDFF